MGDDAPGRGRGGSAGLCSFSSGYGEGGRELALLSCGAVGAIGNVLDLLGSGGGNLRDAVELELGAGDGEDLTAAI